MRVPLFASIPLLLCPSTAWADLPSVTYEVRASVGSWEPISKRDLARAIEHASLEVLSKPGLMQLSRRSSSLGSYRLEIVGRTLDEAETHTVYLKFGPGKASDLPSLNASDTVVLSKLKRGKMLTKIERSARKAAKQLLAVLTPSLKRASRGSTAPPDNPFGKIKTLPWKWEPVRVPKASLGRAKDLYSKNHDKRQAALREVTSLALTEATPRHVLEKCVLKHKDKKMRLGCLVALRPLSRHTEPTQRVVIEVYRKDKDSRVRNEATDQMRYFTGMPLQQAIQAWLESAAAGRGYGPLGSLGDMPNLDLAARKCLVATKKEREFSARSGCLDLLKPIPHQRRRTILWRFLAEKNPDSKFYLRGMGQREGSHGTPWNEALDLYLEGAPSWDPKLEEVLWERYQRTLSSSSLGALYEYGAPSKRLTDRLFEVLKTAGEWKALSGLERMAKADPQLSVQIREQLTELIATGSYAKAISKKRLEKTIKSLERHEKKRKGHR